MARWTALALAAAALVACLRESSGAAAATPQPPRHHPTGAAQAVTIPHAAAAELARTGPQRALQDHGGGLSDSTYAVNLTLAQTSSLVPCVTAPAAMLSHGILLLGGQTMAHGQTIVCRPQYAPLPSVGAISFSTFSFASLPGVAWRRFAHTLSYVRQDHPATRSLAVAFGGRCTTDSLCDAALVTLRVAESEGAALPAVEWGVHALPFAPAARAHHVAVVLRERMLLVHGGSDMHDSATSDYAVALLDGEDPALWSWELLSSPQSPHLWGHSAAVWRGDTVVMFGGSSSHGFSHAVHLLHFCDTASHMWQTLPVSGSLPSARVNHISTMVGDQLLIAGGGCPHGLCMDGIYVLDLATGMWTNGTVAGDAALLVRQGSAVAVAGTRVYAFAGWSGASVREDSVVLHVDELALLPLGVEPQGAVTMEPQGNGTAAVPTSIRIRHAMQCSTAISLSLDGSHPLSGAGAMPYTQPVALHTPGAQQVVRVGAVDAHGRQVVLPAVEVETVDDPSVLETWALVQDGATRGVPIPALGMAAAALDGARFIAAGGRDELSAGRLHIVTVNNATERNRGPYVTGWDVLPVPTHAPSARAFHFMVHTGAREGVPALWRDKLLVVGGLQQNASLPQDSTLYSLSVSTSALGALQSAAWQSFPLTGAPALALAAGALDDGRGRLLLHGGLRQDGTVSNELVSVTLLPDGEAAWEVLPMVGAVPSARGFHTMHVWGPKLVLLGGSGGPSSGPVDAGGLAVHTFLLCAQAWMPPFEPTDAPPARWGHTSALSGDMLYVFGGVAGAAGQPHDSRTYRLKLRYDSWEVLDQVAPPSPRWGAAAVLLDGVWLMLQGQHDHHDEGSDLGLWRLRLPAPLGSTGPETNGSVPLILWPPGPVCQVPTDLFIWADSCEAALTVTMQPGAPPVGTVPPVEIEGGAGLAVVQHVSELGGFILSVTATSGGNVLLIRDYMGFAVNHDLPGHARGLLELAREEELSDALQAAVSAGADSLFASVAALGDVNGDGAADVAIGAPARAGKAGAVVVALLAADGAVLHATETTFFPDTEAACGRAVAAEGNLLAVLCPQGADGNVTVMLSLIDSSGAAQGVVQAYNVEPSSFAANDLALSFVGDVDGDGCVDLAVGIPHHQLNGSVKLLLLECTPALRTKSVVHIPASTVDAELQRVDQFGAGVAGLGDLYGNGSLTVAVSAPAEQGHGAIYLLRLSEVGGVQHVTRIAVDESWPNPFAPGRLGAVLAAAGDMSGDGVADLLVSVQGESLNMVHFFDLHLTPQGIRVKLVHAIAPGLGHVPAMPPHARDDVAETFGAAMATWVRAGSDTQLFVSTSARLVATTVGTAEPPITGLVVLGYGGAGKAPHAPHEPTEGEPLQLFVREGQPMGANFTIQLLRQPHHPVSLAFSVHPEELAGLLRVEPGNVTLQPDSWSAATWQAVVEVRAEADDVAQAGGWQQLHLVAHVSSSDPAYGSAPVSQLFFPAHQVAVMVVDDDQASVVVLTSQGGSVLQLAEPHPLAMLPVNETTAQVAVVLTSRPLAAVTVWGSVAAAQGEEEQEPAWLTDAASVQPSMVLIDAQSWLEPAMMVVEALHDWTVAGLRTWQLELFAGSEDALYNSEQRAGGDADELFQPGGTGGKWHATVEVADMDVAAIKASVRHDNGSVQWLALPEGQSGSLQVQLTAAPLSVVVVRLWTSGQAASWLAVSPAELWFSGGNWSDAQEVLVTSLPDGVVRRNGTLWGSVELQVESEQAALAGVRASVEVRVADSDSLTLQVAAEVEVVEGAKEAAVMAVRLGRGVSDSVLLNLTWTRTRMLVQPAELVVAVEGATEVWQEVHLRVPRDWVDGDAVQADNVTVTATWAEGAGNGADGAALAVAVVRVEVLDRDVAVPVATPSAVTVREALGEVVHYSVQLSSQPHESAATVVVDVDVVVQEHGEWPDAADAAEVWPHQLWFDAGNWSVPQPVHVRAVQDEVDYGDRVSLLASHASPYIALRAADVGVSEVNSSWSAVHVTVVDDDEAAIVLSTVALPLTRKLVNTQPVPAAQGTYTVRLATRPRSEVTVALQPSAPGVLSISASLLVFGSANWSLPAPVVVATVPGAAESPGTVQVSIAHVVASSDPQHAQLLEPSYVQVALQTLPVTADTTPPPVLLRAWEVETALAIRIEFDRSTDLAATVGTFPVGQSFGCFVMRVLANSTLEALGASPNCRWLSSTLYEASLSTGATLAAGGTVALRGGTVRAAGSVSVLFSFGSVSLQGRTPAPTLVSARMTNTGAGITVQFEGAVHPSIAGASGTRPCSETFVEAATSFGFGSTCAWTAPTTMSATLGTGATILPTSATTPDCPAMASVTLVTGAVRPVPNSVLSATGCVSVRAPLQSPVPVAALSTAATVGECESITLDGSLSSGTGGRPLEVQWAVESATPAGADVAALQARLAEASAQGTLRVTVPAEEVAADVTITFRITVRNFLSSHTSSQTATVTKTTQPIPQVRIQGPPTRDVRRAATLQLTAEVAASSCDATVPRFLLTWHTVSGDLDLAAPAARQRVLGNDPRRLTIQPNMLSPVATCAFSRAALSPLLMLTLTVWQMCFLCGLHWLPTPSAPTRHM